jgi:release factor glutamine methyltransferase
VNEFRYQHPGADLWRWRQWARGLAATADIDCAEVDWLLRGLCQVDALALRLGTLAQQGSIPARVSLEELESLWARRVSDRTPIQYLVGQTPWRTLMLHVSPAVLIPRPETELIIDLVAQAVDQSPQAEMLRHGLWVDLGTGSGAIALGIAQVFPKALIIAVDISAAAIAVAMHNAQANGLSDRVQFCQGSWFEPLAGLEGQLAGMVSNPPYIPRAIVPTLQPEVAQHEPPQALDGGVDGLDSLRHLAIAAPAFLQPHGLWWVELMAGQAPTVEQLLTTTGAYQDIQTHADLTGRDRFVSARRG